MAETKPSYIVYSLKRDSRTSWRWLEIGTATMDEDGRGFRALLDRLPIGFDGRIHVRANDARPQSPMPADLPAEGEGF